MVACTGLLVHALVDFNFHIPSNLLLFFLMAHLATAEMQQSPRRRRTRGGSAGREKVYDKFVGVSCSWPSDSPRIPPSGHSSGNSATR
jgi:hypothetical protein